MTRDHLMLPLTQLLTSPPARHPWRSRPVWERERSQGPWLVKMGVSWTPLHTPHLPARHHYTQPTTSTRGLQYIEDNTGLCSGPGSRRTLHGRNHDWELMNTPTGTDRIYINVKIFMIISISSGECGLKDYFSPVPLAVWPYSHAHIGCCETYCVQDLCMYAPPSGGEEGVINEGLQLSLRPSQPGELTTKPDYLHWAPHHAHILWVGSGPDGARPTFLITHISLWRQWREGLDDQSEGIRLRGS